ncbi:MAG: GNAT family N-acetyltransferase, partial [Candidatus Gastranaerophilales bacterium]|nr:GNAT family N-acetyltransferase [Candidatus Gastranaerophilales bacterium]
FHDDKPYGLLIANMTKINENGKVVYSSRHNAAKGETEIDWLVTWGNKNSKIRGVGKALMLEYFKTAKKDKFKDIFLKSELPENSFAQSFYEKMGFVKFFDKRMKWKSKTTSSYIIPNFVNSSDMIIPMVITTSRRNKIIAQTAKEMACQEFKTHPVNMSQIVNL